MSGRSCLIGRQLFHLISKNINFDTLFDTLIQKYINKQNKYNWISVLIFFQGIPLFRAVAASYADFFHLIYKNITFDTLFDTVSQRVYKFRKHIQLD